MKKFIIPIVAVVAIAAALIATPILARDQGFNGRGCCPVVTTAVPGNVVGPGCPMIPGGVVNAPLAVVPGNPIVTGAPSNPVPPVLGGYCANFIGGYCGRMGLNTVDT